MHSALHLQKLQRYAHKHDSLPSLSALSFLLDCSEEEAREALGSLEEQGFVTRAGDGSLLPGANFETRSSPLSSQAIPAGPPAALADDLHESLNIHAYLVPSSARTVIVPVSGDSMTGAGIIDGDLVVIDLAAIPHAGDIVAAEIDGHFTLKRLIQSADGVLLRAENPAYPDLTPSDSLRIHGVLVGLARRY